MSDVVVDVPCGFINVYKPQGMTSHDVVAIIRKRLPKKTKVGHTGTLDPDATGVLPICVGKATRLAEYFTGMSKVYLGELTLGSVTDTQDSTGNIISKADANDLSRVNLQHLVDVLPKFIGKIQQIPPMVSAIKINGQKLCDLARKGQVVERKPRNIEIYDIKIIESDFNLPEPKIGLQVHCSSGTYIRTLFHDIGESLGVGGHMSALERQAVGHFHLANAYDLEYVKATLESGDFSWFIPLNQGICHLPKIQLTSRDDYDDAIHGRIANLPLDCTDFDTCIVEYQNLLVGIGCVYSENNQASKFLQMQKVLI